MTFVMNWTCDMMIDKAIIDMCVGGHESTRIFDTPNRDCTELISDYVDQFLKIGGVLDTLKITIYECEDD